MPSEDRDVIGMRVFTDEDDAIKFLDWRKVLLGCGVANVDTCSIMSVLWFFSGYAWMV